MSKQDFTDHISDDSSSQDAGNEELAPTVHSAPAASEFTESKSTANPQTDEGGVPNEGSVSGHDSPLAEGEMGSVSPRADASTRALPLLVPGLVLGAPPSTAPAVAALSHHPIRVRYSEFEWDDEAAALFDYDAVWKSKTLFQVGYLQTDQGLLTSERRVLPGGGGYSSTLFGITRPLYRRLTVSYTKTLVFVENELAASAFTQRLVKLQLASEIVATTTSGGPGNAHKTDFDFKNNFEGKDKEVIVLVGNHPQGASHADDICAICEPLARVVKRVELPQLPANSSQEAYFRSLADFGELLDWIDQAPRWEPRPSLP